VLEVHNFTYGPVIPGFSYVVAFLGSLLGMRCVTRARACHGAARGRWLLLAGFALGGIGIWAMHFSGLLGFAVAGETTRYSVLVTIVSLLAALVTATTGLLIVGFGGEESGPLIAGGLIAGVGVAITQFLGLAAMRMPGRLTYDPALFMVAIAIAIVAATALLWAAVRLRQVWATVAAALLLGLALSGMHYTVMAAVQVLRASQPSGLVLAGGGGATAASYLLPVILGVSVVSFLILAAVALAPTEEAMRYDAALLDHIRRRSELPLDSGKTVLPPYDQQSGTDAPPWSLAEVRRPPEPR
jgi:NO-binding membrane sensor protein with MHYT domain